MNQPVAGPRALKRPCPSPAGRERELQDLWASAYDGWIDVPGDVPTGGTIYTKPAAEDAAATAGEASSTPFPSIVTSSHLFALTGFNPMGEDAPLAENRAANARLEAELVSGAFSPTPKAWWRAFGFAKDWREDGFVLAFNPGDAAEAEAAVVSLAVKYGQGAIYAYQPIPGEEKTTTCGRCLMTSIFDDVVDGAS